MTTPEGPESDNPTPPEGGFNKPASEVISQVTYAVRTADIKRIKHEIRGFLYVNQEEVVMTALLLGGLYLNHRLTKKTYKVLSNQIQALRSSEEITRAFVTGHDLALDEVDWVFINADQASIREGLQALMDSRKK